MQGENNRHSWTKNESHLKVIKYLPNNNKKKENQYVAKTLYQSVITSLFLLLNQKIGLIYTIYSTFSSIILRFFLCNLHNVLVAYALYICVIFVGTRPLLNANNILDKCNSVVSVLWLRGSIIKMKWVIKNIRNKSGAWTAEFYWTLAVESKAWRKLSLQRDSNPWPLRFRCKHSTTEL